MLYYAWRRKVGQCSVYSLRLAGNNWCKNKQADNKQNKPVFASIDLDEGAPPLTRSTYYIRI